ncbi:MAG TPA: M13 family metallopeptidase [Candidatus Paceibacterota bacterium]
MKPIEKRYFDYSARPQDDFYRYVNGGWMKKSTIPSTQSRWGSFDILHQKNQKRIRELIENLNSLKLTKKSDELRKVYDLYQSSMDMAKRNKQGLSYLQEGFDVINSLSSITGLPYVFAYVHRMGIDAPWGLVFDLDDKESRRVVLRIAQGGIGVPDRNYYTKHDKESKRVRMAYERHIKHVLQLEGFYTQQECAQYTKVILNMEKRLAYASMTPVERRDPHASYNKCPLSVMSKKYPVFNWREYFSLLNIPVVAHKHLIVNQPKFLEEVNMMIQEIPTEHWRVYLRFHFLYASESFLDARFVDAKFQYQQVISGQKELPELWKRSAGIVNMFMEDALGKLFVAKYFLPSAKKRIKQLVKNLIMAYESRLKQLSWMSVVTKKRALKKLRSITLQLGYPDKWQSYKELNVTNESFVKNVIECARFHFDLESARLAKPTDRKLWPMPSAIVNACYSPNLNQITFPAGILQPPFFYPDADDAVNYGAIGSIIGHELTHGFDDEGSQFDEYGNLKNWWKKSDKEHFNKRTKILEKHFNTFKVVDGIRVNGKLTLGENIADLGGVVIAYEAFKMANRRIKNKIDGLTPDQRFFVSYAITERVLVRDEYIKWAVLNDPHSPSEFRVNGIVAHSTEFYEAFNVKIGDELYRTEKRRTLIW